MPAVALAAAAGKPLAFGHAERASRKGHRSTRGAIVGHAGRSRQRPSSNASVGVRERMKDDSASDSQHVAASRQFQTQTSQETQGAKTKPSQSKRLNYLAANADNKTEHRHAMSR